MAQIYEPLQGDSEMISIYLTEIRLLSDELLIRQYNRMVRLGLSDYHTQKLYVLSLRIEFLTRFDKSPVLFEENLVIRLTEEIELL
jgi:hypothetical protein